MASFVEVTTSDIEHATEYCDVRDILAAWRERAASGAVDLSPFLAGPAALMADRLAILSLTGETLIYDHTGAGVVSLLGHDPTGRTIAQIDNPGIRLFRQCYLRAVRAHSPIFAVQHQIGPGAMGTNERLILPVRTGDLPQLLVYIRSRETPNEILRAVFNASTDSISVIGAMRNAEGGITDFRVIAANAETGRRFGFQPDAMIGRRLSEIWPSAISEGQFERFSRAIDEQRPDVFSTRYLSEGVLVERQLRLAPRGDRMTVTDIDLSPVLAASRAIEKQRNELFAANTLLESHAAELKATNSALEETTRGLRAEIERNRALETELVHLARHDGLTGLPNRSHFERRYLEAMEAAAATGRKLSLFIIDLDHFKDINDRFGHDVGDRVLREVSERIDAILGSKDLVGRMGGDEFAVLMTDTTDEAAAHAMAGRMVAAVMRPFVVDRQEIPIGISIGAAMYPRDGGDTRSLTAAADIAVYRAKRAGRGRPVFFDPSMREEAARLHRLIKRFTIAIRAGEIVPYYQPLMDLRTGQLIGFEALARWNHPEKGIRTPLSFSEVLDVPDLAQALTSSMLNSIVRDLRGWGGKNVPAHVSFNVTAFDLRQPDFAAGIAQRLASNGLSNRQLAIEVTETTVLSRDSERIGLTLAELRRLGFSVALDDFGTGYASLSHLLRLPVDSLKIDRSFITDIDSSSRTAAVVRSLVSLAAALNLDIVAEGVETRAQIDLLRSLGCHLVQGYLIAEPMPAVDVPGFIANFGPPTSHPRRLAATFG